MPYYQLLKQRRLSLRLSIQDISSQTRLAPQYIQAVEENNLAVFNDDFNFIRYFIRYYCEAIGVNWNAIQPEVDANIAAYASNRTTKISDGTAENKITKTKKRASAKKSKPKKKKKKDHPIRKRLNYAFNKSKNARYYRIGVLVLCVVLVLALINWGISYSANKSAQTAEAERQAELAKKEQETKKLAEQRQSSTTSTDTIEMQATDKENNVYEVAGILTGSKSVDLTITMPEDSTVVVYKDDTLVSDSDTETVYSDTYTQSISVSSKCTIQVEIGTYSNNKIKINGKSVTFNKTNWQKGEPAVLYFDIVKTLSDTSDSSSDDTSSDSTTDTSTDTTSTDTTTTDTTTTDTSAADTTYYTDDSTYYDSTATYDDGSGTVY